MMQIGMPVGLFLSLLIAGGATYDPDPADLITFAFDGFDPGIPVTDGDAAKKLVERFGLPLNVDKRSGPDSREPGVITEVETWYYDGLEISIWGDYGSAKRWIGGITLTSPKYKLKFGLAIGSPKKAFVERLGPPNPYNSNAERFSYVGTDLDVYDLDIYFDKASRATKIVWKASIH
ncbi:MAG: hypothetical protein BMS9Abin10_0141 [Gammaproteobacteria bacterium]|nr:MAG: hypothetical protein BMS9Abin10_0141 [Gammaproteobacteria bacterium]